MFFDMTGGKSDAERDGAAREEVLVSACLLGQACTYKGGDNRDGVLEARLRDEGLTAVPYCPEESGGLPTPRPAANLTAPAEDVLSGQGRVVTIEGVDVTGHFEAGARGALEVCRSRGIKRAFLKERSPSCGCAATHVDGTVVPGPGVTAALLRRHGVRCEGVEGRRAGPSSG